MLADDVERGKESTLYTHSNSNLVVRINGKEMNHNDLPQKKHNEIIDECDLYLSSIFRIHPCTDRTVYKYLF